MPAKLERCVKQVQSSGKGESASYAICNASLKKGKPGRKKRPRSTDDLRAMSKEMDERHEKMS